MEAATVTPQITTTAKPMASPTAKSRQHMEKPRREIVSGNRTAAMPAPVLARSLYWQKMMTASPFFLSSECSSTLCTFHQLSTAERGPRLLRFAILLAWQITPSDALSAQALEYPSHIPSDRNIPRAKCDRFLRWFYFGLRLRRSGIASAYSNGIPVCWRQEPSLVPDVQASSRQLLGSGRGRSFTGQA